MSAGAGPLSVHRVVLGTVQLGLSYGRRQDQAPLSAGQAEAILDVAWACGIRRFDTAEAYGDAAGRLARWFDTRAVRDQVEVVTKTAPEPGADLVRRGCSALERFAGVARRTLLLHGLAPAASWSAVRDVARSAGAQAGLSVYGQAEVRAGAGLPGVDLLQAPANVFDDSALVARGEGQVRLDLRSVFLQGLLLDPPDLAERRVPGGGDLVRAARQAAAEGGEDLGALLVRAMLNRLREGDRLVIGVDDPQQLDVVVRGVALPEAAGRAFRDRARALAPRPVPARVLDPRSW